MYAKGADPRVGAHKQAEVILSQFRGQQAHRPEWLLSLYKQTVSIDIPANIISHLTRINTWSTNMRYQPGVVDKNDAERFIESVEKIMLWVKGRL
jgi:HEPN domain